jgi:hypothetical protein
MDEEKMDNWRQFQGTELGGLMSQLYGSQKPKINYPKPKRRNSDSNTSATFIPAGAKIGSSDPRSISKTKVHVAVPKRKQSSSSLIPLIECIPKRRSESVIKKEIDDIKTREMYYRPAHVKPVSTESEKNRLSELCEYKGGKALPAALIAPIRETPTEILTRKKEIERIENIRNNRTGLNQMHTSIKKTRELSHKEQLAEQIANEIDERRQYLVTMKDAGLLPEEEIRISNEIRKRIQELSRLELE